MVIFGYELTVFILIILIVAIAIDLIFGELPTKIHPVVFIGKLIDFFSKYLLSLKSRFSGFILTVVVTVVTLAIFGLILALASLNTVIFLTVAIILFSSTFSIKLLLSSAKKIKDDLETGIEIARKSMSYLVSRNTAELSEDLIISASIETLSENITDSAIAPIFYYILTNIIAIILFSYLIAIDIIDFSTTINLGQISISLPLFLVIIAILVAMFYRVINTLDAMVGYKNEKFMKIGYFPAKTDDILNYIPARFAGLTVVLAARVNEKLKLNWKNSYKIMKRDSRNPPSPNSGFTMAAVAGALDITLVKKGVYIIGNSKKPLEREDIDKAVKLSKLAIYQAILLLTIIFLIILAILCFL